MLQLALVDEALQRVANAGLTVQCTEAHAGASSSAGAHAMWNGDISLTLSGTGKGWDLGFDFGKFKISPK